MYPDPIHRPSIRVTFSNVARDTRLGLRLTQQQVADAADVSRGYIAAIETRRANPSLEVVDRMTRALGLEAELVLRQPMVIGRGQRDLVHARCCGHVERRMRAAGWQTAREAEVIQGRSHGWIDLIALHPETETLLVIEIKTRLDDLGSVERQLGWYGRSASNAARRLGWRPRRVVSWLLVLASNEVETVIRQNKDALRSAFPVRARGMLQWLSDGTHPVGGRGLAMVDPASKRREWLIRSRVDGRRSPCRYVDCAAAAQRLAS